jgi:2'-5' RNA ligase
LVVVPYRANSEFVLTYPEKTKIKRLFLALWPDDGVRNQISALQQAIGRNRRLHSSKRMVRPVACKNFHITLHFIGSVTDDEMSALVKSLDKIQCSAFDLSVDHLGHFKQAKSLWVGAKNIPEQLDRLVKKTGRCVESNFETYQPGKFIPHITLFRKANRNIDGDGFEPIIWKIKNFVLVESKTYSEGVEYTILKEWPLSRKPA